MNKENFINEFNEKFSKEFELVTPIEELFPQEDSNIAKGKVKIIIRHKSCGNEFPILISGLFGTKYKDPKDYGKICVNCRYLLTEDEVYDRIYKKFGFMPYEILSPYKDVHSKMKFRCLQCNNIIEVNFTNLMNFGTFSKTKNYYCPHCSNDNISKMKTKKKMKFIL